jgi:hypothetical protein
MKKIIILSLLIVLGKMARSQKDSISLDQLQVPASPAFNILGISPNSIERPKNPTDFAVSLGNATSGFTTIPKDYAVELSPFWIFGKRKATFSDFQENTVKKNIPQTATFSLGTASAKSQLDSSEFRKVAFAIRFSIKRGEVGTEFKQWNDSVTRYLNTISELVGQSFDSLINSDSSLNRFNDSIRVTSGEEKKRWMKLFADRSNYLQEYFENERMKAIKGYKENIAVIKQLAERTDFRRYGFKLDYALGTALDYPDSTFNNSYVSKFSTWLTMGFEKEKGLNWLAVGRFNQNINKYYRNDSDVVVKNINIGEFDWGFRFYSDVTSKLTLSFEWLERRRLFDEDKFESNNIHMSKKTNRYVFSANYKVGKNQNLSFTYGKDFDNNITQGGNLVAALNFLLGFGSTRPFGGK